MRTGLNAFVYMTVSRVIYYMHVDQKVMGIRAVILTRVFVWLDIICFLIQGAGGSMLSGDDHDIMEIGKNIYIAGIALQQAIIVVFSVLTVQFFRELEDKGRMDRPLRLTKWLVIVLIANLALITVGYPALPRSDTIPWVSGRVELTDFKVRIIFRLVEFIPGANHNNPLLTNEVYAWCLDALPVMLGLVLLNIIHPGLVLRGPDSEFPSLSRAEKKEMKKQKKEEKRQEKEARIQRKMNKKAGRSVWVEVDTDEVSLDSQRRERYDDPGVEMPSLEGSRSDRFEGWEQQGYDPARV